MSGYGDKPFGLRAVRLRALEGGGIVALPVERVFKFKERVITGVQRLWDTVHVVSISDLVEFELEAGGISLEAYALMTGRTVTTSGTTPNSIARLTGRAQDEWPYFTVMGQALSENGDVICVLFKCKLTDGLSGYFQDDQFFMSATKGIAIDDGTNGVFEFAQQETSKVIAPFTVGESHVGGFDYVAG